MYTILKIKGKWFIREAFDEEEDAAITCKRCEFSEEGGGACDIDEHVDTPPCSVNGGNYLLIKFPLKKLLENL